MVNIPTQQNNGPDAEWLASITAPTAPAAPAEPQKNVIKRRPILFMTIAVSAIVLIATVLVLIFMPTKIVCLDAQDYKDLTGNDYDGTLVATDNFFSSAIDFTPDSTNYDTTQEHGVAMVNKIIDFYKSHSSSSVVITVSGNYYNSADEDLATSRVVAVWQSLVDGGVPKTNIITENPLYITEDDGEDGVVDTLDNEILVSIQSAKTCSE